MPPRPTSRRAIRASGRAMLSCCLTLGALAACASDPTDTPAPTMHAPAGYERALAARGIVPTAARPAAAVTDSFVTPTLTGGQAARGAQVYGASCARCHTLAQHTGAAFTARWANRRLSDLYYLLLNTMPQDAPGSLTEQQYVDVVAYLLSRNGFAAGTAELRADTTVLRHARIATALAPKR